MANNGHGTIQLLPYFVPKWNWLQACQISMSMKSIYNMGIAAVKRDDVDFPRSLTGLLSFFSRLRGTSPGGILTPARLHERHMIVRSQGSTWVTWRWRIFFKSWRTLAEPYLSNTVKRSAGVMARPHRAPTRPQDLASWPCPHRPMQVFFWTDIKYFLLTYHLKMSMQAAESNIHVISSAVDSHPGWLALWDVDVPKKYQNASLTSA